MVSASFLNNILDASNFLFHTLLVLCVATALNMVPTVRHLFGSIVKPEMFQTGS